MTDHISIPLVDDLDKLTPAQLSDLIRLCRLAAKIGKAAEAHASAAIARGSAIPGWELRSARTSRDWKSEAVAIEAMRQQGINDPYERKLLSVAAAEKKVPHPERLAAAWESVPSTPTLQPVTIQF